jgi:hypothetical protein
MEIQQALIDMSNDARGWLRAWAKDFTEAEAHLSGTGEGRPNPLAWQLGHVACVEDDVGQLFGDGPSLITPGYRAGWATGSPAPTASTAYPTLAELWSLLEQTHARLVGLVAAASAADLDRPPRVANPFFRSLGQAVYEAALHENYHVGEIGTLRKALGKPRIG